MGSLNLGMHKADQMKDMGEARDMEESEGSLTDSLVLTFDNWGG